MRCNTFIMTLELGKLLMKRRGGDPNASENLKTDNNSTSDTG